MSNNYLIYKHTSPSGKSYIGQTNNLSKRSGAHKRCSSKCRAFNNAIRKYGWDLFTTEILAENLSIDQANQLEEQFISEHNTLFPYGYNLLPGGNNHRHTETSRRLLSEAHKGRIRGPMSVETLEKLRYHASKRKGIPLSPERLQQVRECNAKRKGQPLSEEHLQQIRENGIKRRGKPAHNKGKQVSEETKIKIRAGQQKNAENRKGCKRIIDPITGKISYIKPELL